MDDKKVEASKENAAKAMGDLRYLKGLLPELNQEEIAPRIMFIEQFMMACSRRLPTEYSIEKNKKRSVRSK